DSHAGESRPLPLLEGLPAPPAAGCPRRRQHDFPRTLDCQGFGTSRPAGASLCRCKWPTRTVPDQSERVPSRRRRSVRCQRPRAGTDAAPGAPCAADATPAVDAAGTCAGRGWPTAVSECDPILPVIAMFSAAETEACRRLVELALAEDLGSAGDITSQAIIP